jgi:predicted transcriptional regulator
MASLSENQNLQSGEILQLATRVVAAYVSNNPLPAADVPTLIRNIHTALGDLSGATGGELHATQKPAVPVKRSVTPDYIVCLEDGKKLKMLKRHLRSRYNLTPEGYRAKWGLPVDYPMVAPNYASQRSDFAKKIGLGRVAASPRRKRRG